MEFKSIAMQGGFGEVDSECLEQFFTKLIETATYPISPSIWDTEFNPNTFTNDQKHVIDHIADDLCMYRNIWSEDTDYIRTIQDYGIESGLSPVQAACLTALASHADPFIKEARKHVVEPENQSGVRWFNSIVEDNIPLMLAFFAGVSAAAIYFLQS